MILILLLLLFCTPAYATQYVVEKTDGSVAILDYNDGSQDSLQEFIKEVGYEGRPVKKFDPRDIPLLATEKIEHLELIGSRLQVNQAKKDADAAAKQAIADRKEALAQKMGLTKSEYQEAKDKGLLK